MNSYLERNFPSLSIEEQEMLEKKHVLIVGAGGLGGYILEFLTRVGVKNITIMDGDVFEDSNMNRQILASVDTLGHSKAEEAKTRALKINPAINITAINSRFTEENAEDVIKDIDLVMDALDNIPSRLLLAKTCEKHGITIIHGAINGWLAQVCVVTPGSGIFDMLYGSGKESAGKSSLSFTPPLCAAIQCAEAVKLLAGRKSNLAGKLLIQDLKNMSVDVISLV